MTVPKVKGSIVPDNVMSDYSDMIMGVIIKDIKDSARDSVITVTINCDFKTSIDTSRLQNASVFIYEYFNGDTCIAGLSEGEIPESIRYTDFDSSISFECKASELFDFENYIIDKDENLYKFSLLFPAIDIKNDVLSSFFRELSDGPYCFDGETRLRGFELRSTKDGIDLIDIKFPYEPIDDDVVRKWVGDNDYEIRIFDPTNFNNSYKEYLMSPKYYVEFYYGDSGDIVYELDEAYYSWTISSKEAHY